MRKQLSAPRRTCPEVVSEDLSPDLCGWASAARPSCPTGTPTRTGEPPETASVARSRLLTRKPSQRVLYGHAVLLHGWLRGPQAGLGDVHVAQASHTLAPKGGRGRTRSRGPGADVGRALSFQFQAGKRHQGP